MPYTPDATDVGNPPDTGVKAATAAAEFRTVKLYMRDVLLAGVNGRAPINNPVFTGIVETADMLVTGTANFNVSPRVPTPPFGDTSTKAATMAALAAVSFSAALPGQSAASYNQAPISDGTSALFGFRKTTQVAGTAVTAVSGSILSLNNVATTAVTANATPVDEEEFSIIVKNGLLTNTVNWGAKTFTGPLGSVGGVMDLDVLILRWDFKYNATFNTWNLAS